MTDFDVIREWLMDEWTTWERETRTPENNEALAALSRVETEATAANNRMDEIWAEKQAAEARVTELEAALADADEIIDDCWHQFAIDIRGKLTPGGLSTLEMVDDYRNTRDGLAALAKEDTDD